MKPKIEKLARIAQVTFYKSLPWYGEKDILKWNEVPIRYKQAWRNVAKAILKQKP